MAGRVSNLLRETLNEYWADSVPQLAAALAFYTIFSLAPFLIIAVAIVSLIFGGESAREQVTSQVQALAGPLAAGVVEGVLDQARQKSPLATVIGILTVLAGSTAAFVNFQEALNRIWGITAKPSNAVVRFFTQRLLSFVIVLALGFLLLATVALSAAIFAAAEWIREYLHVSPALVQGANVAVSFLVVTAALAIIYKVLPDADIEWRYVWVGAAVTALLFSLGKQLIGLYLARGTVGSVYGAAGSYVVFLVWVYYTAQVFLLGAEFTEVYVRSRGDEVRPNKNGLRVKKVIEGQSAA